jgi:uncharacterized protein DUF6166
MSRVYRGALLRDVFGRPVGHRVWVEVAVGRWEEGDWPEHYSRELNPEAAGMWSWGSNSPGGVVLAAYLLLDAVGDWERAAPFFVRFADDFVSLWPERWSVREETILRWLLSREQQAAADEATQRLFVAAGIKEEDHGGDQDGEAGGGNMGAANGG